MSGGLIARLRAYLAALLCVTRWRLAATLLLMVAAALSEGLGLLLLVPMLGSMGLSAPGSSVHRLATGWTALFRAIGAEPTLPIVLGGFVVVGAGAAWLKRMQVIHAGLVREMFASSVVAGLYAAFAHVRWTFYTRQRGADLAHALTGKLDRVAVGTEHVLSLAANALVTALYLVVALAVSPGVTAVALGCGAILLLLLRGGPARAREAGELFLTVTSRFYATVVDHLQGFKTAKTYGAMSRNAEIFAELNHRVSEQFLVMSRTQARTRCRFEIATAALLAAVLYVSLGILGTEVGALLLLLALFIRLIPRLAAMLSDAEHVAAMLPVFADVTAMQARFEAAGEPPVSSGDSVTFRREIRLEDITVFYEDDRRPALAGLSLSIRAGETTAIVGPSGSGKSTVVDVLMGLVVPTRGEVRIDGVLLRAEGVAAWRDQVGYVAQDTLLFHDSLRANLRWASPGATEEEMRQALLTADALDFATALPQGLDTPLGDRGVLVSGGERQRIALARALLRRPTLLILDEATSALDAESERRIQQAIERLAGRMTILVITHRLATVRAADTILVVEAGTVVESGDWASLIGAPHGRFRDLCIAQHLLPEEIAAQ